MKNRSTKKVLLVFLIVTVGLVMLGQILDKRCSASPKHLDINSAVYIEELYPWPGAKIPLVCHAFVFLKSPLAPRLLGYNETVFKEDGILILGDEHREGVVIADLSFSGDLFPVFIEPIQLGEEPLFAKSVYLYIDGKELKIGHISYREFDFEFKVTTILNPFLLPGNHTGKVIIRLPDGESLEYEWQFEVVWW